MSGTTTTASGTIVIGNPVALEVSQAAGSVTLSWPDTTADTLLQASPALGAQAQWQWVATPPTVNGGSLRVTLPVSGNQFFRISRPW